LIAPHGGTLVDGYANEERAHAIREEAGALPSVSLNPRQLSDAHMIAQGAFSPLNGFMGHDDYNSVVRTMHLGNGLPWSLPITLGVDSLRAPDLKEGKPVSLTNEGGEVVGVLTLEGKYRRDREEEAREVYRTTEDQHPGVANVYQEGDVLLAGRITMLPGRPSLEEGVAPHYRTPGETREAIADLGWSTVVGFQTRNPVHRAHEYIQKCALEVVDGLLIHPLVGRTKSDDIPADVRMRCYETLIANYYPRERTLLSVFPASMRYAGPREAIFHALVRKNYGCTHFIVGRDHAGVGNYYGTFDAHHIFDEFEPGELGITPLFFDHTFYCTACEGMASSKTCPHDEDAWLILSGTKLREMLRRGEEPPHELTRPEVAQVLVESLQAAPA
jgi:sulfate adenylyltransferase